MNRKFPHLCSPITLGRTSFRNRMFSAPMGGTDIANDSCIGPKSTAFYELRAKGGGLAGCECAIHLGQEGRTVRLVEMRDQLAPDANVRRRPLLRKEIDQYVEVYTGHRALRVTENGVICADQDGNEVLIPGKSVICALGQRSKSKAVEELRDCAPFVRVIGDAARVSTITNAVYWGYHAALDI